MKQGQVKSKLISGKGVYKRICMDGIIDHADSLTNPVGNGFFGNHKLYGPIMVIEMGPNKGMWISVDSIFYPQGPNYWRNLTA